MAKLLHWIGSTLTALRTGVARAREESGASAMEYALIAALIAVAAIGAMRLVGGNISDLFDTVADELADPNG